MGFIDNRLSAEKTEMELNILREKKVNGIITRAKAKWQIEGEKSTRYFCNLEKRHYLENLHFNHFPQKLKTDIKVFITII
jgi:hypothetical protein